MDPLAHTLAGAALARTRLGRGIPLAAGVLIAAANIPDLDVLAYVHGEDAALGCRRGPTHGPIGLLLLPPLVVAVALVIGKLRARELRPVAPIRRLLGLAYLGALSHPLLDLTNTYGVRLLSPLSERWSYGDTLFIVDPWLWLLLAAALVLTGRAGALPALGWALLATATSAAVLGAPVPAPAKLLWALAIAALALLRWRAGPHLRGRAARVAATLVAAAGLYVGAMFAGGRWARADVRAELVRRGVGPVEALMVGPLPADPFGREVVVQVPDGYLYGSHRAFASPRLRLGATLEPKASAVADPRVATALADPSVGGFVAWARFPFARVEEHPEGSSVHLLDARYLRVYPPPGRRFGMATVELRKPASPP